MVLSCTQDDFFAKHRNANFGDLGVAVKGTFLPFIYTPATGAKLFS